MDRLRKEIIDLFKDKIHIEQIIEGKNNENYVYIQEKEFLKSIPILSEKEFILANFFCVMNFENREGFTLFFTFIKKGYAGFLVFYLYLLNKEAHSIALHFPIASIYEREIRDGFGINFIDSFDQRRLFLHEIYPEDFHPLMKTFLNHNMQLNPDTKPDTEYVFKNLDGEGTYQIPVGPVHAGIIEPGHFRFSVIGEEIFNLEIRMFYKHRGLEKLAEGKSPLECLPIAEAISGDETAANSFGFCNAVEKILDIEISDRAAYQRMVYLEMERIYSLLGDLAGMVTDVAYPVGSADLFILREEILRFNEKLTGSRFLKGAITIGGVNADLDHSLLQTLSKFLDCFLLRLNESIEHILDKSSIIDRFETTGIILKRLVPVLNLTGPIARSSSVLIDARIDNPYCRYHEFSFHTRVMDAGDVFARFKIKSSEIIEAVKIIKDVIKVIPKNENIISKQKVEVYKDGYSISVVESARGQNIHWVYLKNGKIFRYKIKTASFCNWLAIEHAVIGNIVPDFPLINKSLNLSYAGNDL